MIKNGQSSANNWDGPHPYSNPNYNPEFLLPPDEPAKCMVFGCGRSLTRQEQLFGNICQQHQKLFYLTDFIGEFDWADKGKAPAEPGL